MTSKHLRIIWVGAAVAAALALTANGALAANAGKEVKTAAAHAGYAAQSKSLKVVRMHLHHAVNCLVGPKGMGFDSKELDPCKGMGNGAIPDTKDMKAKQALRSALATAKKGLAAGSLAAAKAEAKKTEMMLKKVR